MSFASDHSVTIPLPSATSADDAARRYFDKMSESDSFSTYMTASEITVHCAITSVERRTVRDFVADSQEFDTLLSTHTDVDTRGDGHKDTGSSLDDDDDRAGLDDECDVYYFDLTERVRHLGFTKDIAVKGEFLIWRDKRLHLERRSASGGLVRTWKIRRFLPRTPAQPRLGRDHGDGGADTDGDVSREHDAEVDRAVDADDTLGELVVDTEPRPADELGSDGGGAAAAGEGGVEIVENLLGQTNWLLKSVTESQGRATHLELMSNYASFLAD